MIIYYLITAHDAMDVLTNYQFVGGRLRTETRLRPRYR